MNAMIRMVVCITALLMCGGCEGQDTKRFFTEVVISFFYSLGFLGLFVGWLPMFVVGLLKRWRKQDDNLLVVTSLLWMVHLLGFFLFGYYGWFTSGDDCPLQIAFLWGILTFTSIWWLGPIVVGFKCRMRRQGGIWLLGSGVLAGMASAIVIYTILKDADFSSYISNSEPFYRAKEIFFRFFLSVSLLAWLSLLVRWVIYRLKKASFDTSFYIWCCWVLVALSVSLYVTYSWPSYEHKTFVAEDFKGETASIVFPSDEIRELCFKKGEWGVNWVSVVKNRVAIVPAGKIKDFYFRVSENRSSCVPYSLFFVQIKEINLAAGETYIVPDWFPLNVSLVARKRFSKIMLDCLVTDASGNKITRHSLFRGMRFDAVTLDGDCFWNDEFCQDSKVLYFGTLPENAPATFIFRPVLSELPFEVVAQDTVRPPRKDGK